MTNGERHQPSLNKFGTYKVCPKCEHDIFWMKYVPKNGGWRRGKEDRAVRTAFTEEHLLIGCDRCGFRWYTACAK